MMVSLEGGLGDGVAGEGLRVVPAWLADGFSGCSPCDRWVVMVMLVGT